MGDNDPQKHIYIEVADFEELITAGLAEVTHISAVAAEAASLQAGNSVVTWDLSKLSINSDPVTSTTVKDWLNTVYKHLHDVSYDETFSPVTTAARLCDLLEFADAVQSKRGVMVACASGIVDADLIMTRAQVEGQNPCDIFVDGRGYSCTTVNNYSPQVRFQLINVISNGLRFPGMQQFVKLQRQILHQTERLLYIAHKLKLSTILSRVQEFITANLLCPLVEPADSYTFMASTPIFTDANLKTVYSDRICELLGFAAESSGEVKRECLQSKHQLTLTIGGEGAVLQAVGMPKGKGMLSALSGEDLEVNFNMAFAGYKKGSVAKINIIEANNKLTFTIGTARYQLDMLVARSCVSA